MKYEKQILLLLILGVTFLQSCNDDDDDKVRTYNGDSLSLSVGGINFLIERPFEWSVLTLKQALQEKMKLSLLLFVKEIRLQV